MRVSCPTALSMSPKLAAAHSNLGVALLSIGEAEVNTAHIEEAERDNTVRELERQLNILNQVTDNVDKLTPQVTVGRV